MPCPRPPFARHLGPPAGLLVLITLATGCQMVGPRALRVSEYPAAASTQPAAPPPSGGTDGGLMGGATTAGKRAYSYTRRTTGKLAVDILDAGPAPDAGFLPEPERMVTLERDEHPFHRVWVSPLHDRARYTKILIAPVSTDHVLENSFWDKTSTATFFGLDDDVKELALRLHDDVARAFREDPHARFAVVDEADAETLILELALVEVVPNKSFIALGALAAMAAPPAISVPLGTFASRTEHGYVAMEGRVRDGASGEIVAMFADRETAKTRVLDLQSVLWYGHAYEIFDEWAEQLVAVANRPEEPGLPDPTPFTMTPW